MSFPRTASELREVLDAAALAPRRRHGQHFLTDPQAVDAIVRDAGVRPGDRVVEVGTGPGLLTHALCEAGAEVRGFEVDPDMLALARRLREWPERVAFVECDVLATKHALAEPFRRAFARPPGGRLLLVSNLPYGAGTPILLGVLGLEEPPDDVVVTLQREVVDKLLARPGSSAYGATSVVASLAARGERLRHFPPEVFWPRPRVRSSVVRLTPRRPRRLPAVEHHPFGAFTTALFSHRRKILPSALRLAVPGLAGEAARAAVGALGIPPTARVQEIEPGALLSLWRGLAGRGGA